MSYIKRLLEDVSVMMGLDGRIVPEVILLAEILKEKIESGEATDYLSAYNNFIGGNYGGKRNELDSTKSRV